VLFPTIDIRWSTNAALFSDRAGVIQFPQDVWMVVGWSAQCQLHKVGNSERHSAERD